MTSTVVMGNSVHHECGIGMEWHSLSIIQPEAGTSQHLVITACMIIAFRFLFVDAAALVCILVFILSHTPPASRKDKPP